MLLSRGAFLISKEPIKFEIFRKKKRRKFTSKKNHD